ncbi:MAG: 2,3-bisphosphoglycerate-independent phosphoglycerate mutase [Patescibacteria group bacterium]
MTDLPYDPVVLIILDGWGINPRTEGNAVKLAKTPFLDGLFTSCPHARLFCAGEAVGLPEGQMGTSEVGHLNLGAGRVIDQSLVRITKALQTGELRNNGVLQGLLQRVRERGRALHFMGLVSPGGVHSHTDHLYGFIRLAVGAGVRDVYIHAFLDGRDTPPQSALAYLAELEAKCAEIGAGRIATVSGRYYAMDRDKRWDRVEKAFLAMVEGKGEEAANAREAVEKAYAGGITDEFVLPTVITEGGKPVVVIRPGDGVIFFNFRPDRAREITRAFVDRDFKGFARPGGHPGVDFACLTLYDETIEAPVIFPPEGRIVNTFAEVASKAGLTQLHTAETEKYAHVTFFFNGGVEPTYPGEDRVLIPSPKVPTYDQKPSMSAVEVTDSVLLQIASGKYRVIIINYANCDMVGHTGDLRAAIAAVETVDGCLARVVPAVLARGGAAVICADHGNAEQMVDYETGEPHTAHTTNPVPVILAGYRGHAKLRDGMLADVVPTLLELLGLPQPAEMTGKSLIVHA